MGKNNQRIDGGCQCGYLHHRFKCISSFIRDFCHVLENIIYLELIRRGYSVSIGKVGTLEVDFIATKPNEKIYYQVSATI